MGGDHRPRTETPRNLLLTQIDSIIDESFPSSAFLETHGWRWDRNRDAGGRRRGRGGSHSVVIRSPPPPISGRLLGSGHPGGGPGPRSPLGTGGTLRRVPFPTVCSPHRGAPPVANGNIQKTRGMCGRQGCVVGFPGQSHPQHLILSCATKLYSCTLRAPCLVVAGCIPLQTGARGGDPPPCHQKSGQVVNPLKRLSELRIPRFPSRRPPHW